MCVVSIEVELICAANHVNTSKSCSHTLLNAKLQDEQQSLKYFKTIHRSSINSICKTQLGNLAKYTFFSFIKSPLNQNNLFEIKNSLTFV